MKIKVIHKKMKNNWGLADPINKTIEIDERAKGKKHLEILNHELTHILFPDMSEEDVERISIEYTNLLWKLMYRRVDNANHQLLQNGKK